MNETTEEDYSDEYNFTCDPEDMDRYYNMTAWRAACHQPLQPFMVVIQIFYALICVLGLCGNTLVIYVVLRYSKMQTVTNLYIFNLALADECFLVGESVDRREIFVSKKYEGFILKIAKAAAAAAADAVIRNPLLKFPRSRSVVGLPALINNEGIDMTDDYSAVYRSGKGKFMPLTLSALQF